MVIITVGDTTNTVPDYVYNNAIYTRDVAAEIISRFEAILDKYNIKVPSPEDDQREPDNEAKLYGSVYSDLLDDVEGDVIELLGVHKDNIEIIEDEFSGNC